MKTVRTVSSIYRIATAISLLTAATLYSEAAIPAHPGSTALPVAGKALTARSHPFSAQEIGRKAKSFDEFADAIHQVETAGRQGRLYGDGGRSFGPLQISYATWKDATRYTPSIGGRYADCKDLTYSKKIMLAYLQAHDLASVRSGDWEACARLWNAGPGWRTKRRLTNAYWADVKGCLMAKVG